MQGKGRPPGHRCLGANPMPGPTAELRLQPPGPRERNFYCFRGLQPAVVHYGGPQTQRSSPHLKVFNMITSAEFLPPHKRTRVQVPGTGTQTSLPPTLLTTWSCTGPWGRGTTRKVWLPESPPAGKRHPWRVASNSGPVLKPRDMEEEVSWRSGSLQQRTSGLAWEGGHAPPGGQEGEIHPPGRGQSTSHTDSAGSLSVRHPSSMPVRSPGSWDLEAGARARPALSAGGGETAERPRHLLRGLPVPACVEGPGL